MSASLTYPTTARIVSSNWAFSCKDCVGVFMDQSSTTLKQCLTSYKSSNWYQHGRKCCALASHEIEKKTTQFCRSQNTWQG